MDSKIEKYSKLLLDTLERARTRTVAKMSRPASKPEFLVCDPKQRRNIASAVAAIMRRGRVSDARVNYKSRRIDNEYDLKEAIFQIGKTEGISESFPNHCLC